MASSIQLNSTNNSEMKIEYQGTSGVPKTVVVPDRDMTLGSEITLGTAVTASGTSVDFTGIPAGVKRITVMFDGVSTNGTSLLQVQLGSTTIQTTGYSGNADNGGGLGVSFTNGMGLERTVDATTIRTGVATFVNLTSNLWVGSYVGASFSTTMALSATSVTLSGTLDRIRITTVNGTDTFDAGSINISWEF